ncbi:ATP-binding protein, partial [Patescibacteria group bacterium]|nr:ATP-binding protein [Patescibacteria group bacterium]
MLIKVKSVALHATSCIEVLVEVNIASRGLPAFDIVGLASKAVYESRERVKSAIRNSGFDFPTKRITVNLAPADLPKEGSFYDLPIAIAIICGSKGILVPENALFFGELSLDGTLRHIRGAISLALYAKEFHISQLFVPAVSAGEAACIKDINVYGVSNLRQVITHLSDGPKIIPMTKSETKSLNTVAGIDFKNIIGQYQSKRALEIAAAGKHSLLLVGPPG